MIRADVDIEADDGDMPLGWKWGRFPWHELDHAGARVDVIADDADIGTTPPQVVLGHRVGANPASPAARTRRRGRVDRAAFDSEGEHPGRVDLGQRAAGETAKRSLDRHRRIVTWQSFTEVADLVALSAT